MKVVVIGGPTGVGKSELAFLLAENLNGELISCDSVQVFKHLSIGANKTPAGTPGTEHLLDVAELDQPFTAADYYEHVIVCIKDILLRGKLPIVVGGSGFYLEWLLNGRPAAPETNPEAMKAVEAKLEGLNWNESLSILSAVDPETASNLLPNDFYRLKRALAVYEATKQPLFAFKTRHQPLPYDFRCFFLTAERESVCRNIDRRCEEMIERGLIEEVFDLKHNFGLKLESQAGRSIGYHETLLFLDSSQPLNEAAFIDFLHGFKAATRQYSRKQENWFQSQREFKFIPRQVPFQKLKLEDALLQTVIKAINLPRAEYDSANNWLSQLDNQTRQLRRQKSTQIAMKVYRPHPTSFSGPKLESILARIKKLLINK